MAMPLLCLYGTQRIMDSSTTTPAAELAAPADVLRCGSVPALRGRRIPGTLVLVLRLSVVATSGGDGSKDGSGVPCSE